MLQPITAVEHDAIETAGNESFEQPLNTGAAIVALVPGRPQHAGLVPFVVLDATGLTAVIRSFRAPLIETHRAIYRRTLRRHQTPIAGQRLDLRSETGPVIGRRRLRQHATIPQAADDQRGPSDL